MIVDVNLYLFSIFLWAISFTSLILIWIFPKQYDMLNIEMVVTISVPSFLIGCVLLWLTFPFDNSVTSGGIRQLQQHSLYSHYPAEDWNEH